jgi:TIR domain
MIPSVRVRLILKIFEVMKAIEWREMDLVLSEFGFLGSDFEGGYTDTLLHRLRTGGDVQLTELAAHYEISIPEPPSATITVSREADRLWQPDRFRLFISHTSLNRKFAHDIKRQLAPRGFSCFVAHDDIEPSAPWERDLRLALKSMDGLLALLTEDFQKSSWTDQEIGCAIVREVPIVPLSMPLMPYGFISHIQTLRKSAIPAGMGAKTIAQIFMATTARQKIARSCIACLSSAPNYADATTAADMIDTGERIEPALLQRLFDATCENSQILPAHYVANKIDALFSANKFVPNINGAVDRFLSLPAYSRDVDIEKWLRRFGAKIPERTLGEADSELPF